LLMFGRQVEFGGGSTGFASGLVGLFADSLGPWIRPVIGIAAMAVMLSTVIAVIDAFPRVYADVLRRLFGIDPARGQQLYLGMLAVQALIAFLILGLLFRSFGVYIDFATTAGFVSAPAIAILNHRVMTSPSMPSDQRPSAALRAWSASGAAVLTVASLGYLYFRFA
jgi:mannose/fructose/N-acetylgalactosamine-specific phosphotransferase system component IIC